MKHINIILLLTLTACATRIPTPPSNISAEERSNDINFCVNYATQKALLTSTPGTFSFAMTIDNSKVECLKSLGWNV